MTGGQSGDRKAKAKAKAGAKAKSDRAALSSVNPEVHELIGRRLRVYFDEVAKEPVPDRFVELLSKLESKGAAKKSS